MAKKHKHPEHENLERWLVSYADFITLLFATFTALYAMAKMDTERLKDLEKYIQQGFQQQSVISGVKAIFSKSDNSSSGQPSDPSVLPQGGHGVFDFESLTYKAGEVRDVAETVDELDKDLKNINAALAAEGAKGPSEDGELSPKGVDVSIQERGLKISFDSSLLFNSGSAALRPQAHAALDKVAERLKKYNYSHTIQVEGHTDDIPISTAIYPSNWELSTARASSVVRYFIGKEGFSPTSMVAVGYGASRPLTSNTTGEGRRKNRRVDIILYSKQVGDKTDPKTQTHGEKTLIDSRKTKTITQQGALVREESESPDGPAQVIIVNPDGSRKIMTPIVNPNIEGAKPNIAPNVIDNEDGDG